jgi:hypothetical protein
MVTHEFCGIDQAEEPACELTADELAKLEAELAECCRVCGCFKCRCSIDGAHRCPECGYRFVAEFPFCLCDIGAGELVALDDDGPEDDRWQDELFAELELYADRSEADGAELGC